MRKKINKIAMFNEKQNPFCIRLCSCKKIPTQKNERKKACTKYFHDFDILAAIKIFEIQ